jgi:uncharacterized protein YbjT (DUF2867 family)
VKQVVIAGSTGEVGKRLVSRACANPELIVHALVRREGAWAANGAVHEIVFDYEDPGAYAALFREVPCDALLIALGTTTGKAGVAGLERVDRDYPLFLIDALQRAHPHAQVGFCSSVGADRPRGHYLLAKAAVERGLQASSLATAIARPSLLISDRGEFRPLEVLALPLLKLGFGVLKRLRPRSSFVWKYAPVHAAQVAACLLTATLRLENSQHVLLEGAKLHGSAPTATSPSPPV